MNRFSQFIASSLMTVFILTACQPPTTWAEFKSPDGKFSVRLPGTPTRTIDTNPAIAPLEFGVFRLTQDNIQYIIAYYDYSQTIMQGTDPQRLLTHTRTSMEGDIDGTVKSEKDITLDNQFPGREVTLAAADGKQVMRARIFLVNNRMYRIEALGPKDQISPKDIDQYLISFTLLNP
jgi:hypothetical protein